MPRTLLQKAKQIKMPEQGFDEKITKGHIDLALGWLKDEITTKQFSKVLGYKSTAGIFKVKMYLKEAYRQGYLIIR